MSFIFMCINNSKVHQKCVSVNMCLCTVSASQARSYNQIAELLRWKRC